MTVPNGTRSPLTRAKPDPLGEVTRALDHAFAVLALVAVVLLVVLVALAGTAALGVVAVAVALLGVTNGCDVVRSLRRLR